MTSPRPRVLPGTSPAPSTGQVALTALPPRQQPHVPVPPATGLPDDPDWYRKAVFYEVMIRSFSDSRGDGSGDIRGLIDRLDYLQWLGIDCLWLLPFYPSPMRDGG